MKKIFWALIVIILVSCEYKDLSIKVCYLSSEDSYSGFTTYSYNQKNELVSYSNQNIFSSVLTYNEGKIVSELDNEIFSIAYTYDNHNRIVLWSETIQNHPEYNRQTKFFYNAFSQDTLQQFFRYSTAINDLYLWRFTKRDFTSTGNKNYSRKRTYDGTTNSLLYTEEFLWDNHPNPYLTNVFFLNEMPPTNNMTQYVITVPGQNPRITNFGYTYNGQGFPLYKLIVPDTMIVGQYNYSHCQ